MCHVIKLTFKFLAQNMRTHESWWFLLTSLQYSQLRSFRLQLLQDYFSLYHFVFHIPFTIVCSYRHFSIASVTVQLPFLSSPLPGLEPGTHRQQPPSKHRYPSLYMQPLQSKGNNYFKVSERVTSPIETLLACTPLTSQPFHIGYTSLISGVDRLEVINSSMLEAQRRAAGKPTKVLFE